MLQHGWLQSSLDVSLHGMGIGVSDYVRNQTIRLCNTPTVLQHSIVVQAALERDIQETLNGWKAHLASASFILVHAPSANAAALFAGAAPPLARSDPRVRGIPFATRHGCPACSDFFRIHMMTKSC